MKINKKTPQEVRILALRASTTSTTSSFDSKTVDSSTVNQSLKLEHSSPERAAKLVKSPVRAIACYFQRKGTVLLMLYEPGKPDYTGEIENIAESLKASDPKFFKMFSVYKGTRDGSYIKKVGIYGLVSCAVLFMIACALKSGLLILFMLLVLVVSTVMCNMGKNKRIWIEETVLESWHKNPALRKKILWGTGILVAVLFATCVVMTLLQPS